MNIDQAQPTTETRLDRLDRQVHSATIDAILFVLAMLLGMWIGYAGMSISLQRQCQDGGTYRDGRLTVHCQVTSTTALSTRPLGTRP